MKHIIFLALSYLRHNKIKTLIMVFSVTVVVFLPLAVNLLVRNYQHGLLARAEATPLVAGAPGSRIDLVLHALYFRGQPAHDLTMGDVKKINNSGLALAIPILCKHTARGVPIVGTSLEYFTFRGLRIEHGDPLTRVGDCLLGAVAAKELGLHPGDKLMSDPDNVFDLAGSYPINMHVKGILASTGTPDDRAVFVDYKTEWIILGIMHGHKNVRKVDPSMILKRAATNTTVSAAVLPFQEVTDDNIILYHVHGDPSTFPVGAIIVVPHDSKSSAIIRGRYEDPKAPVQLLVPTQIISETLDLVFRVKRFFDAQSLLVGVAMTMLLALVILLSLRLRRGEMETMFKIGCARRMTFSMQTAEIFIVVVTGVLLATGLAWGVVREFGFSGASGGIKTPAPRQQAPASKRKCVAVVNYPLEYFTKRIAGNRIDVLFPIPPDQDPAFWHPTKKAIIQYQHADLILRNGAAYAKWRLTSVLPLTTQVVTSEAFADRYMKNGEVITHSHGPGGLHSHGLLDFNVWLDPTQAVQQAQCIHDRLVKLMPDAAREYDTNLVSLQNDLTELDSRLAEACKPLGNAPIWGSHPVYHYLARRYGWNLESVHWEPNEVPSEEAWAKFEKRYAAHPARIMLWESTPLPVVAKRLRKMGILPVVFKTCCNIPSAGDYMDVMNANAQRLARALRPSQ